VAHPGASPATGTHWWLTASIPQARSAERHPGCAPHRLGLALDAARSAPLADSLSDLSRVAYGWHLTADAGSTPRDAPYPPGASPPTVGCDYRYPDGEDHRKRGPHGDDRAKKLNGRKRHLLDDTTGLLRRVLVHSAALSDADMASRGQWLRPWTEEAWGWRAGGGGTPNRLDRPVLPPEPRLGVPPGEP
jgi:hypothetical protein